MKGIQERLAILVPSLVYGGAQRSMLKLAAGITARGYHVDFVLSQAVGELVPEIPRSVALVDLHCSRALASLPKLVSYLRRERPAALLSVLHTNLIAVWAKRITGVQTRVILSERNTPSSEAEHYRSDLRFRLMPRLMRAFYPWADGVIAVSEGVADDLTRMVQVPAEKIHVIYNPVVTPELQEKMTTPLSHPWLEPGQPPVILAVGRLTEQKDFPSLIQAFAQVRQTHMARLMILGEGEERPVLESMVAQLQLTGLVSLPGFVSNPYPYMRRASLFVLSSRWEGLPGVLIEALYSGIPLIASDCPSGPNEILAGGQHGRLVPVGDIAALRDAIKLGLEGKIPRPTEDSWRRFELESVTSQYLDVLFGQ